MSEQQDSKDRPRPNPDDYQPGDPPPEEQIARMIRVNHAGEFGAARIYEGQLAVFGTTGVGATIQHMADQEQHHLETFDRLINERRVRPTLLSPIWHVAGFALGAGTALLGKSAAMACTEAVEEVIDDHYRRQQEVLGQSDPELATIVEEFRADEMEHRDIARAEGATAAPGYPLLRGAIKSGTKLAIWLSTRV